MIKEAIVLAGGFGTRLKSVVSDIPKPMAPVAGKPFLDYVLTYLQHHQIDHCILAVGHLREQIISYFGSSFNGIRISYSEEETPLGTGGGIKQACEYLNGDEAFVINGDTFFNVDLQELYHFHKQTNAKLSMALKPMTEFDRYGTVEIKNSGKVDAFLEKKYMPVGLINGGVYTLNKSIFSAIPESTFSFEKEVLERRVGDGIIYGLKVDKYFIDIGIPEDYQQAQNDFAQNIHEAQ